MKEWIFLFLFLLSAGCGTLTNVALRKRLGRKLEELDEEEADSEGASPEEDGNE